jgi:hypothetical protein
LPLPDVYFGSPNAGTVDWRDEVYADDAPDDDEQLAETPADVIELLGFDPLESEA